MKSVGFWPRSVADNDVVSIDFGEDLLGATIQGTPVAAGVNCTAAFESKTPAGVVTARVTNGTYAGAVEMTIALSDGRSVGKQVDLRFL